MTSVEALRAVNEADKDARNAYERCVSEALQTGTKTEDAAKRSVSGATAGIVIACVVFGFLLFTGPWFLGILVIGIGIYGGYKYHESASRKVGRISSAKQNLDTTIGNNRNY